VIYQDNWGIRLAQALATDAKSGGGVSAENF